MLLARRSPAMARVCNGAPSRNRAARNERLSMHPSEFARATPDKAAIIMAGSGQTVTFAQFEARSNQGAHLLRGAGLQPGAVVALMLENDARYLRSPARPIAPGSISSACPRASRPPRSPISCKTAGRRC
jgi:non-ribosomal peptide synthetase component F